MNKKIKKQVNDIYKLVAKLQKKPVGMANADMDNKDPDKIFIHGVEIDKVDIQGKKVSRSLVLNSMIQQWGKHFGKGRFNRIVWTEDDVHGSDLYYYCLYVDSLQIIVDTAHHIARKILGAIYEPSVFDCDDFLRLIAGLCALVAYRCGIRNAGVGVGSIKIDYYNQENKLCGHALNCAPVLQKDNSLDWKLIESQNTRIYSLPKETEIHYFEI